MILEIGLSFTEGLALIVSPCILPVLPLVLSASAEGGRRRPFGIITGFVIAFTAFALLSRKLVTALHIDLDYIKYGSLLLLALFGVILLSEKLSAGFSALTQRFASAGSDLTAGAKEGYFSGILIGMLIGMVWTPCAGPILAAVLVQVIREQSDVKALFLVASFALGAGVPMLAIALAGRSLLARLGFFTRHAEAVRKAFGAVILLAVVYIASGADLQKYLSPVQPQEQASGSGLVGGVTPYPAPEFKGVEAWLNSPPLTMESLKGKVVLVDFWTYSCINCVRTLPYITTWDKKYRDKGLVIVGVHAPEFEFEKSKTNVEAAIAAHGIAYPVALDNKLDTWESFKNRYWPAHYLIDRDGRVVYTHFGEGAYNVTENNIRFLLGLDPLNQKEPGSATAEGQSPETYLGKARAQHFDNTEPVTPGQVRSFAFPASPLPLHHWALSGQWRVEGERIISEEPGARLRFHFHARKVFLVLGTRTGGVRAKLTLNGAAPGGNEGKDAPGGRLDVKNHSLYELIRQDGTRDGTLEITAEAPGLEAYAFTFGN